jgi:hypothetical protein
LEDDIIQSVEICAMIGATIPNDPSLTDLVSRVRMGLTPSSVLPAITGTSPEERRGVISLALEGDLVDCSTLITLPDHVIQTLIRKFVRHVVPQTPIMLPAEITQHLQVVLAKLRSTGAGRPPERLEPSFDFLVIYIILAISSTLNCAKSQHESRCIAFSEILFREGTSHLSANLPFPNELAGIQATLLILLYAEINPNCGNIWILTGAAMRSCVDLGLHREPKGAIVQEGSVMELRRRVFWMAYCMDRTVSPALQRPLSIPDSNISALYPNHLEQLVSPQSENPPAVPCKPPAIRLVEYNRIQSQLTETHFQGKPLAQSWANWLVSMEQAIDGWYQGEPQPNSDIECARAYALVRLHRPSPRSPMPSKESLLAAFSAACKSAVHHKELITSGIMRKMWLASHHTAETAMVAAFGLRHAHDEIVVTHSAAEIFDMMKNFTSNLLMLSARGWTEISSFAATYEQLLAPLLAAVFKKTPAESLAYPTELDLELNNFLLPQTASWDSLFAGNFSAHTPDFNIDMDMDNLMTDEWFLEAFVNNDQFSWDGMSFDQVDLHQGVVV